MADRKVEAGRSNMDTDSVFFMPTFGTSSPRTSVNRTG